MEDRLQEDAYRFATLTDDAINDLLEENKSKNTIKNTTWSLGIYNKWRIERNARNNEKIPELLKFATPEHLSSCLARLVVEARRQDGKEYPPNTIYLMLAGLLRHMRENGIAGWNFLDRKDDRFLYLRRVLEAKLKDLSRRGIGSEIKRADAFTKQDEEICWQKRLFGSDCAESLLHTIYFYNCKLFHLRGCDEHRRITIHDISIGEDSNGKYVDFIGNTSKNSQGGMRSLARNIESKTSRYYSQENDHGIVDFYHEYISICRKLYDDDPMCDAFYRRPLSNIMNSIRFSKQPIGVNYLSKIIKTVASKGELKGRFTAHSGKATGISQMYDAGVPEITIQQRSGNRSLDSLRKYSRSRTGKMTLLASQALIPGDATTGKFEIESEDCETNSSHELKPNNEKERINLSESEGSSSMILQNISHHQDFSLTINPRKRMIIEADGDRNTLKFSFL